MWPGTRRLDASAGSMRARCCQMFTSNWNRTLAITTCAPCRQIASLVLSVAYRTVETYLELYVHGYREKKVSSESNSEHWLLVNQTSRNAGQPHINVCREDDLEIFHSPVIFLDWTAGARSRQLARARGRSSHHVQIKIEMPPHLDAAFARIRPYCMVLHAVIRTCIP